MAKRKANHKHFKHEGGFIGLPRRVFESPAYRDLSLSARCLLDEMQSLHRPQRNGRIGFSITTACERLSITYKTASKAFEELQSHGFIDCMMTANSFGAKAREWRLTYEPYQGKEPTDDWINWTKDE